MSASSEPSPCCNLYSVGHSNHDADGLLALLQGAGITALADVRSSPFSRRLPQFNRPQLEALLRTHGLTYVFLGDFLGGRPSDDELYDETGRVVYEQVRRKSWFNEGLERLLRGAGRYVVAMLCSEEDPLDCHRGLMITPALLERGVAPLHLHKDGIVETTADMEMRLLVETGLDEQLQTDLFTPPPSEEEVRRVLAEAYRVMGRRKAYRREAAPADE